MNLKKSYSERKAEIKERISEFRSIAKESDERIFLELAFCLCTPQSKAKVCWNSVSEMANSGILYKGSRKEIRRHLAGVRFANNKAGYIVNSRDNFSEIKKFKEFNDPFRMREFLVKEVKGFGFKEAGHFLRNVGHGDDLAILDRHILRNLMRFGVISEIPKTISKKKYLEIEQKMREFSQKVGIPLQDMDLLFWSIETGGVFK